MEDVNITLSDEFLVSDYKDKASELYLESIRNLGLAYFSVISDITDLSFDKLKQTAFQNVKKAARFLRYDFKDEPTRSVYYFHACVIALDIGLFDEAIILYLEMSENKSKENIFVKSMKEVFSKRNIQI